MWTVLLALTLVAVLVGCTRDGTGDDGARRPEAAPAGCGPLSLAEVRGRLPGHLAGRELTRFANDHHVCDAVWLRTGSGFVPQGLVVEGRTAVVSGFDGDAATGHRYCELQRYDLRTGRRLGRLAPVRGRVGDRAPVSCRHAGGLVRDEHGLWLAETTRLWLLDPGSLDVRRAWALRAPLRGSFAVHDGAGRLGLGRWYAERPGRVDWLDPDALLASSAPDLTSDDVAASVRAPATGQGAVWAAFGRREPGLWFSRSVTRCGQLVGPAGVRRGLVPGAEGMALGADDTLWVISESGSRYYQEQGGRPVVPMLLRFDVSDVRSWQRPDCRI